MKQPDDYTAADGWDDLNGCDCCPRCEVVMSANGGYFDTVFDQEGNEYASNYEADPMDGPFFCEDCWNAMLTAKKESQHRTLNDF